MHSNESAYRVDFYKRLRTAGFSCQPIESPGTGDGIPDAYVSSKLHVLRFWIEFKHINLRTEAIVKIPYEPGQYGWLTGYGANGTVTVLAVSTGYGEAYFSGCMIKKEYSRHDLCFRSKPNWTVQEILSRIRMDYYETHDDLDSISDCSNSGS